MVRAATALAVIGAVVVLESLGITVIAPVAGAAGEALSAFMGAIIDPIVEAFNPLNWF